VNQNNRSTGETQKEMAEEEGLWPVLKWVKRLIDGVLIEDFGETEIEFAWGEDAQIDAGQQAQVLTSYVGAGILTRNEARVKLGQAPVSDPAANVLLAATGAGPVAIGHLLDDPSGLKKKVTKAFDPNEQRGPGGKWTTGAGGGTRRKSDGPQVAQAVPLPLIGAAAAAAAAVGNAVRETVDDWRKSHRGEPVAEAFPSTTNEPAPNNAEDNKPADATPQTPVAAAPPIPPEDNHDREEQEKGASTEKPENDGAKSPSATEWDGKRLAVEKVPADWGDGRPNGKGVGWRW
ncbi:MAG: hypothetical protein WB816_19830, partial [Methylocystis sp.]